MSATVKPTYPDLVSAVREPFRGKGRGKEKGGEWPNKGGEIHHYLPDRYVSN